MQSPVLSRSRSKKRSEPMPRRALTWMLIGAAMAVTIGAISLLNPASSGAARRSGSAVVVTQSGLVRGIADEGIHQFLGIPYAAPPVGRLRWQAPQPPKRWRGVRDATRYASNCPQEATPDPGLEQPSLDEDCLALNVVTPDQFAGPVHSSDGGPVYSSDSSRHASDRSDGGPQFRGGKPVYVFIHGGGFTVGHAQYETMQDFVRKTGVVAVTPNYRLGALGFLDAGGLDPSSAGTFGLLDQLAALRWVHHNISEFGGDPSNVTIAGQSAGALSVCALLASPAARGLLQRAVIESGGNCSVGRTQEEARKTGDEFVARIGCSGAHDLVGCLRRKPVTDVLAAQAAAAPGSFQPVVGSGALPMAPNAAFASGSFNRVPVVIGANSLEFGGTFVQCLSYAEAGVLSQRVPTYLYDFADETAPPLPGRPPAVAGSGTQHSAELQYLYMFNGLPSPLNPVQRNLGDTMIRYWDNFVANGNPNGPTLVGWLPFTQANQFAIRFTADSVTLTKDYGTRYGCAPL